MAKLRVLDKVGLGEFIIKAAQNVDGTRDRFLKDPVAALRKFVEIPADRKDDQGNLIKHTIAVYEDTRDVTNIMLPWKDDVDRAMQDIERQTQIYPLEYRPGSPDYIDDRRDPKKALFFRFGEYMFGRCK